MWYFAWILGTGLACVEVYLMIKYIRLGPEHLLKEGE